MAYIATKPCKFAGQSFRIGEVIPAEFIQPGAARNLVTMGKIAEQEGEILEASEGTIEEPKIKVTIHAEEGDMELNPTEEGLQAVFDVLTANVSDAEAIITGMTDVDALILLDVSDKRKSIGDLTKARAMELSPEEGE